MTLRISRCVAQSLSAVSVVITTVMVACTSHPAKSSSTSASDGRGRIVVRVSRPAYIQIDNWVRERIEEYEAENPQVHISYEPTPGDEYLIKLRTMLSVGTAPDAYMIANPLPSRPLPVRASRRRDPRHLLDRRDAFCSCISAFTIGWSMTPRSPLWDSRTTRSRSPIVCFSARS